MTNINTIEPFLSKWEDLRDQMTGNPIIFKIQRRNQHLYYFGSNHTFDPNHPQFKQLKEFFEEFIRNTKNNNSVVAVEGGVRPIEANAEETIQYQGESGYTCFLASQKNIRTISPEPERKDEIQYYYFARVVHQWNRTNPKPNFEKYLSGFLKRDAKESGWIDYDFSIENMKKVHKNIFGTEFDENNKQFFYNAVNPVDLKYVTNNYSREMGINRDAFIVKTLINEWNQGNSIFIVFGSGHALTERNALEEFIN